MRTATAMLKLEAAGYICEIGLNAILYVRETANAMPDRLYVRLDDGEVSDIKVTALLNRKERRREGHP
jgi:hypothetical protein